MKYAGTFFWGFLAFLLLGLAVRGLHKGDFSASGMKITRTSTPKTFWFYFVYHLVVGGFLLLMTLWRCISDSKEP